MGAGTITITRGTTSIPITVVDGTSLAALRTQINAAQAGVTAAIIQDGATPRLVITGQSTGLANAVTIAVTGATGQLTALGYPAGMTQDRPAADVLLRINGLQITMKWTGNTFNSGSPRVYLDGARVSFQTTPGASFPIAGPGGPDAIIDCDKTKAGAQLIFGGDSHA